MVKGPNVPQDCIPAIYQQNELLWEHVLGSPLIGEIQVLILAV